MFAGGALVLGTAVAQFASTIWSQLAVLLILGVPAAYMAAAVVVSGSRVRDETMRRYMRWMGFIVGSVFLQLATSIISQYLNFPLAIFAYFLYGMSASLLKTAPLRVATEGLSSSLLASGASRDSGPT